MVIIIIIDNNNEHRVNPTDYKYINIMCVYTYIRLCMWCQTEVCGSRNLQIVNTVYRVDIVHILYGR